MSDAVPAHGTQSASERFRTRWRGQLAWSISLAALLHLGALTLSPGWEASRLFSPRDDADPEGIVILPILGETTFSPGMPAAPALIPGGEDGDDGDLALAEGGTVLDMDLDELWESLGDRLRRGEGLRPTIAQPQTVAEVVTMPIDQGDASDEGDLNIGGDAIAADLVELPEPDSLSLDRLSALRPELAFMSASAWVLIRNQAEVEAYLRRGYREGRLDPASEGSVAVTLWIDKRGSVEWAEVSKSSGHNDLDEFALALFNEVATFRAARERGVYVSRSVTLSVNFPW